MKMLRVNKRYRPTVKREKRGELVGRVLINDNFTDIVYRERRVIASLIKTALCSKAIDFENYIQWVNEFHNIRPKFCLFILRVIERCHNQSCFLFNQAVFKILIKICCCPSTRGLIILGCFINKMHTPSTRTLRNLKIFTCIFHWEFPPQKNHFFGCKGK